jgi:competence CoiA-like predicted nuclease
MILKIKMTFEWKFHEWKDFSHVNITSITLLIQSIFYVLSSYSSPIFNLISANLIREKNFLLKISTCPHNLSKSFNYTKRFLKHSRFVWNFMGWNFGYQKTYSKNKIEISSYCVFIVAFQRYRCTIFWECPHIVWLLLLWLHPMMKRLMFTMNKSSNLPTTFSKKQMIAYWPPFSKLDCTLPINHNNNEVKNFI